MQTRRIQTSPAPSRTAYLLPLGRAAFGPIELKEFVTIGRDLTNTLVLADAFVSLRHARIELKSHGFVVRDQNSSNGTFLNGSRVVEASLSINDQIRFGESVFVFSESSTSQSGLTSRNETWQIQLKRLPAFAVTDFPVLITGPSGSGKEVIARWLHDNSPRSRAPFVSINCSALSESLIESELFGHIRGSFTGAMQDRKGAFESARGGTLFLDEIGDLPISLQPKLLRALENREIRPLGSDRSVQTDVRILAATHKNLPNSVQNGKFREDLYYRLNVCPITPPALVERMEDFETLVYQFAKNLRVRLSHNAIEELKKHRWPGNIRELKNAISRAAAYYPGENIQPEQIASLVDKNTLSISESVAHMNASQGRAPSSLIKEIERDIIIQRLVANRGNQRRTAEDLGLPKSTLHDRIKLYKIDLGSLLGTF